MDRSFVYQPWRAFLSFKREYFDYSTTCNYERFTCQYEHNYVDCDDLYAYTNNPCTFYWKGRRYDWQKKAFHMGFYCFYHRFGFMWTFYFRVAIAFVQVCTISWRCIACSKQYSYCYRCIS